MILIQRLDVWGVSAASAATNAASRAGALVPTKLRTKQGASSGAGSQGRVSPNRCRPFDSGASNRGKQPTPPRRRIFVWFHKSE
jgi:hypothetical protein